MNRLAFAQILFTMRTVVISSYKPFQHQLHVLQRPHTETNPENGKEEEKQSKGAKISRIKVFTAKREVDMKQAQWQLS